MTLVIEPETSMKASLCQLLFPTDPHLSRSAIIAFPSLSYLPSRTMSSTYDSFHNQHAITALKPPFSRKFYISAQRPLLKPRSSSGSPIVLDLHRRSSASQRAETRETVVTRLSLDHTVGVSTQAPERLWIVIELCPGWEAREVCLRAARFG